MEFIAHRINTSEELKSVPRKYGVEIDLRDRGDRLVLSHDPFCDGEDFSDWLENYHHGTLIVNVKSERIEHRVLELLSDRGVRSFFFLDSSFPMLHLLGESGETRTAIRYSEYEGMDTVMAMAGRAQWVWVDCFSRLPLDAAISQQIEDAGFRICLVSPELQAQDEKIEQYAAQLQRDQITCAAICTKLHNIERWRKALS